MFHIVLKKLRAHLHSDAAYRVAAILMGILEVLTGLSLIWHFFFRNVVEFTAVELTVFGGVFAFLVIVYMAVNLPGKYLCFKVQGFFYLSVALFFLLKGVLLLDRREFSPWGFYLLWIALLIVTFRETLREIEPDISGGETGE
jgi:hypothetical protein